MSEGYAEWCQEEGFDPNPGLYRPPPEEAAPEPDLKPVDFTAALGAMKALPAVEVKDWTWKNEVLPNLKAAGLPERFWRHIQEWGNAAQEAVYKRVSNTCRGTGAIVALIGPRGTGKTTIAAQMIIARAMNESLPPWDRSPIYRKLTDIIARYKPLYADFGSTQTDGLMTARDSWCKTGAFAVIDEIHECEEQRLKDRILTDILDRRYASRKDTVIISNQSFDEFQRSTNDSVLSRISEHGLIIPCEWQSWRSKI